VKRTSVLFLLAAGQLAACARQQTPVLTPVRVEATPVGAAEPTRSSPAAPPYNVATDDPFFTTNRMDWPGPNLFRSSNGAPGPAYWQQRADYTIAATLDTTAQAVSGTVRIRYTNNSPDTLRFVWLQLDQNLYRPGSKGSALFPADSRWGVRGFQGGYDLKDVSVNGKAATFKVDDTMMRVELDAPLRPQGGTTTIAMAFSFRVPEHGSDRMGRDGTLYEMAQWYPRMAVYDDVRGWNTDPYLGQGEFYLEYGDFDYSVTAPAGYVIAGSGVLQNPQQVLSAAQRERLARAAGSQEVVQIVTAAEARPMATPGIKTWRFRAERVRDVAWAGAPDFRWDAVSTGPIAGNASGVLAQAYYPWPRSGQGWESGAENTQWTLRTYSENFLPYPYPQATSVAGPVGGMEYPMFVLVHYAEAPQGAFGTIDHEHGHEWFPMIVGSNERRYAWMDEGFNTYINAFSNERRAAGTPRADSVYPGYIRNWQQVRNAGIESPLMTPPDHIDARALGAIGYRKPGAVLLTLRNHVVGRETFDEAFRLYTQRWAFKHPTPGDFFRTVENVSGEDLSWFWRGFFYSSDVLDIGVGPVTMRGEDGEQYATIPLTKHTTIPFPVQLRVAFADGSTQDFRFPVDVWAGCPRGARERAAGSCDRYDAVVAVKGPVVGVRLWPDPSVPDWNAENNSWGKAPAADPLRPVTGGGLTTPMAATP
jgi:hypothetical protein